MKTGAVAGIGVACALVGALIAGLIVFLIMSHRKSRRASSKQVPFPSDGGGHILQEKGGVVELGGKSIAELAGEHSTREIHDVAELGGGHSVRKKIDVDVAELTTPYSEGELGVDINRLLPQPAGDNVLISGLSMIRDDIKNHVQKYYHSTPVDPNTVDEARLIELATVMALSTSSALDLLLNPATRMPTIRLFLAHVILSRCRAQTDGTLSFLPSEASALASWYRQARMDTTASQMVLFSKWKTISGALLQQRYSQQPDENDPREASIMKALATTEPILRLFVNPSISMNIRRRNLEGIMRRAAQYAFLMFCQPSSFIFDFTKAGKSESLVVFPALLITINNKAERLLPPRVLSKKEVVPEFGE